MMKMIRKVMKNKTFCALEEVDQIDDKSNKFVNLVNNFNFVVPEEIYPDFQAQNVEYGAAPSKNGVVYEKYANVTLPDYKVKQFVMSIDSTKQDAFEKIGTLSLADVELDTSKISHAFFGTKS